MTKVNTMEVEWGTDVFRREELVSARHTVSEFLPFLAAEGVTHVTVRNYNNDVEFDVDTNRGPYKLSYEVGTEEWFPVVESVEV